MTTSRSAKRSRQGLSARVIERLRRDIITMRRAPGSHLDEVGLAEEFSVSRTPIREALKRLAAEDLVELSPGRGAQVAPIRFEDVGQYFDALRLIQKAILLLAAERRAPYQMQAAEQIQAQLEQCALARQFEPIPELNLDFHRAIGEMAGNDYLQRIYLRLLQEGARLSWLPIRRPQEDWNPAALNRDHRDILAAIEAGDGEQAIALADRHTELFKRDVIEALVGTEQSRITLMLERATDHFKKREQS